MSAAVPVVPFRANHLSTNERELQQFLLGLQEKSPRKYKTQIVSFSLQLDPIDPLSVLAAIARSDRTHFYWENAAREEAILGFEVAKSFTINSGDRFAKSQKFIEECLDRTVRIGDLCLPGSGPYLFCSFTFFESQQNDPSPFPRATVILPSYQIVRKKQDCTLVINLAIDRDAELQDLLRAIQNKIKAFIQSANDLAPNRSSDRNQVIKQEVTFQSLENFRSSVAHALKSIQEKQFSKIVLAHSLDVTSDAPFQIVESLNNLRQIYPDCYIFSLANGRGHHFIGASPERLLSVRDGELITDALAGSAPRGKNVTEDDCFAKKLLRSEKEKREHKAVTEFITERLSQLGLKPQRSPLKLLKLSNIQHLWTPIYAKLPSNIHPLEIVAKLHPTPAVAGVPTEIACEQIRQYESFNRGLYAAPIGWINYQGNGEFIVGIRSASIEKNRARLYAGAGIVSGSDPDKEMAEIQLKFQALLKALL
ncbi:isochorismate synthase family protein [Pleurocapsa sp. PCC 7327]|uniref:isochorismate synthase n=1 Tax=Pleurocapsa sp. PCC 7327 TaxID=118163 RepID=UPI00029FDF6E|nr:isochorismate synthase [Pleurocapsa sp. PCC 7327]AFY75622.1 isochorismate synthase family protein [Pleurocapsa sp. PCC 7327]